MQLDFTKLLMMMKTYPDDFVLNEYNFEDNMGIELEIAHIAGIPFNNNDLILNPKTLINIEHLSDGCPGHILDKLNKIIEMKLLDHIEFLLVNYK